MSTNSSPFADACRTLGIAVNERPVLTNDEREEINLKFVEDALRRTARERWEAFCPPKYKHYDINHPSLAPYRRQIDSALAWSHLSSRGLLLSGPTDRGKTRTVWELLRRLAYDQGIECVTYHAVEWFAMLQENVRFGNDEARGWVEAVAARPLIYLDDYGQEAVQQSREQWSEKWFMRFLDRRVERGLPLLVTTNLTAKDLAAGGRLDGDPLLRRLLDVCEPVVFDQCK